MRHHDPPHHRHQLQHPPHSHVERFLDALRILVEAGLVSTVEELAQAAERLGQPEASRLLRLKAGDGVRVERALDLLTAEFLLEADRRNNHLIKGLQNCRIALVLPLPPHVMDIFLGLDAAAFLIPSGHHIPPHLRHARVERFEGTRACRRVVAEFEVLVFEAFPEDGGYSLDPDVADIVDHRILPPTTRFIIHAKPHVHPDDVFMAIDPERVSLL